MFPKQYIIYIWLLLIYLPIISCNNADSRPGKKINNQQAGFQPGKIQENINQLDTIASSDDTITIIGVGDIMLGTNYPSIAYLPQDNDCEPLLSDVKHITSEADITFGNLEGCFLNNGPVVKKCSDPSVCYAFRTPEAYFKCIVEAGFDLLSLANNHSGDFGKLGKNKTIKLIEEAGLHHAGLLTHPYSVYEKDGIKYGFCAFSPIDGNCRIEDEFIDDAVSLVKKVVAKSDIVIVSFHGGAEGKKHEHVTRKTEYFCDEDRGNVYNFAHKMIDAGADIIFGHGPHVTRAIDIYKDRFIIYSLGNFCTYGRFCLTGSNGYAPIVKVFTDQQGKFIKAKIVPIYQAKNHGPKIDPRKKVIKRLRELTKQDFPGLGIVISENGIITHSKNR